VSDFRYVPPSPRDLDALASTREMQGAVETNAERGWEHAQSIAPKDSGHYADSFRVEAAPGKTAAARLVNDADYAAHVEWKNGDHVLSRTADFIEANAR